ncbi:MAG: TaqI-like C-terminal specificity domain-containing protein [Kiritimatiellia bacterium]
MLSKKAQDEMGDRQTQQIIRDILERLDSLDGLKRLFWQVLNYERANKSLSPRNWPESARQALAEDPVLFASAGDGNDFHVVYCRLTSTDLSRGLERPVVTQLLRDHPYALYVFSNKSQSAWHFLNVKLDQHVEKRRLVRRITVRKGDGLRTAAERLSLLDVETISADLFGLSPLLIQQHHDEAFDVERVTKDFYKEIANWYFWARGLALFPKDAQMDADGKPSLPLIRLLTRLIFCWFLREKRHPQTGSGLIPDALFDTRRIKELLNDSSPSSCTYYTAILQNLFFATLNTEMDTPGKPPVRRFLDEGDGQQSDDHMVHQLWRHTRQLRDPSALAALLRDIPFLNGGLFECLDDRVEKGNSTHTVEVRIDGFATDPKKQPKLPNFLFFGAPQAADLSAAYGDSSRRGETVLPLLDILNRYNFTLTENTPFDQEVALDPELLGHVFENLLAAFNPETGTVARKATGSFYTPRVIVDWMVDQALLLYLGKALLEETPRAGGRSSGSPQTVVPQVPDARLPRLLSWEEEDHDFQPAEVEKLIDAIDGMKALDPACGSGAFPMGLLQKLVHVLTKLDKENKGWHARQEHAAAKIESGPAREEALKAIQRAFARDNDDYGRKLYLIENCLYGVDIQPIAVQIAKLRFFISLVVDQSIDPKEENYGILPLPNLETKVVAANTLLGLHRGQLLLGSNEVKRLEGDLQKVRHGYFTARSYKRKRELRKEDKRLCNALATALQDSGECTPYDAKRLAGWNPYDTNTHASFFDPGWMFGLAAKSGDGVFNIVIGNPPYVRQEELKNQEVLGSNGKPQALKDVLRDRYECFTGTADLYVYFFERSLQLLQVGGVLSFITSNRWFRAGYGEKLRTYLAYATRPGVVLDFGDAPVFTAIAYPAVVVTQKVKHIDKGQLPDPSAPTGFIHPKNAPPKDWQSRVMTWLPGPDIRDFPDIFERDAFALAQRDLKPNGWRMESPVSMHLLERLRMIGTPLGVYVKGRFYRGILTGLNEAFVVDRDTRARLIAEHKSSAEVLKPYLRGRDVKRWRCEPQDLWLIFTRRGIDIKKYPAIHSHLKQFRKRLTPGVPGGRKPGSYEWYEIQDNIAYWQEFEQPKIIYPDIYKHQSFAWDVQGFFSGNTTYFIPSAEMWMAPLLNSSAVEWFYAKVSNKVEAITCGPSQTA